MGDVLSQAEIDALLAQLTGDNSEDAAAAVPVVETKEARLYNFALPSKFSKEQLRTLNNIFENFSRTVSSFLTGYLRTTVELEVASSEQILYKDFNLALMNPVVLAMTEWPPLKGTVLMEMSNNMGYAMIDRILGGPGFGIKNMRDFSEIEAILLERIMAQMLTHLPEAWETVIKIKPRIERLETNSQFAQIMSPNEMVALVLMRVKIGSTEGHLNFCLPHMVLEPIMDKLKTSFWFSQRSVDDAARYRTGVEDELEKALVPVSAVVGKTNIMVSDFVNLQKGDVLK
ncbi:MAG: flagellar motor switch protein FliM, partial [Defluviitaleaceae bacterium]|nr:flagellar motor switch protein FliM [Defluviitaleaceae bacterium]